MSLARTAPPHHAVPDQQHRSLTGHEAPLRVRAAVCNDGDAATSQTARTCRPGNYTEQELYGNFSRALNATGRPMVFSMCEWGDADVQTWGGSVAQMWRIQVRYAPSRNARLRCRVGIGESHTVAPCYGCLCA